MGNMRRPASVSSWRWRFIVLVFAVSLHARCRWMGAAQWLPMPKPHPIVVVAFSPQRSLNLLRRRNSFLLPPPPQRRSSFQSRHTVSSSTSSGEEKFSHDEENQRPAKYVAKAGYFLNLEMSPFMDFFYGSLLPLASLACWMAVSAKVLSFHPDPRFVHCSWKHNILTISQAWSFPLFVYRENLVSENFSGVTVISLLLAANAMRPDVLAFGYSLIPRYLQWTAGIVHGTTAVTAGWLCWRRHTEGQPLQRKRPGWAQCVAGLSFAVLGIMSLGCEYPLATVPSLLGKRLSRVAALFYLLAAQSLLSSSVCESNMAWGSIFHLVLVVLKLVGVDDGGLLLPGRGLWEWYPAWMAVPRVAAASFGAHLFFSVVAIRWM